MENQTLTIEEVLKNGNSNVNQDIKGKFIGREVFCNVATMVEYCLRQSYESSDAPFSYDDIENFYSYPEYYGKHAKFEGGSESDRDEEIERLESLLNDSEYDEETHLEPLSEDVETEINEEIEALRELESEQSEIYEWWAVSGWFADKLKEQGQCILDAGSCMVWGRCTTGQAILLDYVITRICADMEILDGQSSSWANQK